MTTFVSGCLLQSMLLSSVCCCCCCKAQALTGSVEKCLAKLHDGEYSPWALKQQLEATAQATIDSSWNTGYQILIELCPQRSTKAAQGLKHHQHVASLILSVKVKQWNGVSNKTCKTLFSICSRIIVKITLAVFGVTRGVGLYPWPWAVPLSAASWASSCALCLASSLASLANACTDTLKYWHDERQTSHSCIWHSLPVCNHLASRGESNEAFAGSSLLVTCTGSAVYHAISIYCKNGIKW